MMRYKGLLLLPLLLFIYSCQTMPSKFQLRENKSMVEAEEYINMALRGKDFSAIDTLLMLTEEYFKESSEILKEETVRYENELGLYRGGKIKQEPAVPKADHARIINGYKAIMQKHPNKPGMSSALYILGYALYEQGELEQALKVFEDFTERYKESPYYTEINFRLGEIYFDTSQFRDAINAYKRILDRPDSIFYEKALYKSGWAYYKMDDYTGAIDLFSRIVDKRGRSVEAADSLADESFHNIVRSMSRMKTIRDIEDAVAVIKFKSYAPDTFLELVRLFIQETRYEEAISTYNIFKALFPDDADLPMLYKEMAGVYEKLNNNGEALRIKELIVANYNPTAKLYAEKYPNGSKEVDRITAETLLDLSKEYHRMGREKNDVEAFKKAVKGYEQYLYYFPNSADYKNVNILLAEVLFDAKEYTDAAVKYEYIMRLYKGRPQGEKAAYAALLAYELIAAQDVKKMEMSAAAVKRVVDYCKMEFSGSAGLENLIYKAADVYARLGYYREAKDIVSPLLKGSSQSYAYKKMGEIYIAEKDTVSAIDAYTLALKASNDKDNEIRTRLAQLHYMAAVDYIKQGKSKEAAGHYLKVFSFMKDSDIAERSLVNVGQIYIQSGDTAGFKTVIGLIKEYYPYSKWTKALLVEAGKKMEQNSRPAESALLFEEAARFSQDKQESQQLILAAAGVLERSKEYDRLEALLIKYIASNEFSLQGKAEAFYILGSAQIASGKNKAGKETLTAALKTAKLAGNEPYAARARIKLAEGKTAVFLKQPIEQPFEKSLKIKESLMKEILDDYKYVIASKVAELLPESFYRMGLVFEGFRDALLSSERPADLSKKELEDYNFLLEEKAYPLEEQAVKAYEASLTASVEYGGNELIQKDIERLSMLRPAAYKREFDSGSLVPLFIPRGLNYKDSSKKELLESLKSGRQMFETYDALGALFIEEGSLASAAEAYKNAIMTGGLARSMINLGSIYQMQGKEELALKYYKDAEAIEPLNPYLNYNIGVLLLNKSDVKGAVVRFKKAAGIDDKSGNVNTAMAKTFLLSGEVDEALNIYRRMAEERPEEASLHKEIGIVYELYKRDYKEALKHYSKYVTLDGKDSERIKNWIEVVKARAGVN